MARNIKDLHPHLQDAIKKIKKKFPDIGIGECVRTVAEQNALYAKGRTAPGKIVTNAKGSSYSSQHQWGIAFDFFYNKKGKEFSDPDYFRNVGAYAKSIGLGWGGDWKNPTDMPHIYLPDWGKTPKQLKAQYQTPDRFKKTWNHDSSESPGSGSSDTGSSKPEKVPSYRVGNVYTIKASDLIVRKTAGGAPVGYTGLTTDGQKHDKDKDGALDRGTRITCKGIKYRNDQIWLKIPSGWVCAKDGNKIYVK